MVECSIQIGCATHLIPLWIMGGTQRMHKLSEEWEHAYGISQEILASPIKLKKPNIQIEKTNAPLNAKTKFKYKY